MPLQLSFDFAFDEETERFFVNLNLSHNAAKVLGLIPEFILIFDTILKFFTGYYENGLVITKKSKIRHHYFKKGLIFDLFAYCPIIAQNFMKGSPTGAFVLKFFQLLMFFKIRRVQTIMLNFQEMISLEGRNDYLLSIFNLACELIFFTHIIACVWHGWAYYDNSRNNVTWLDVLNLRAFDWFTRYTYSLNWAVSTVFSIGNVINTVPENTSEHLMSILVLMVSGFFYVYIFHTMRDYFTLMNRPNRIHKQNFF